MENLKKLLKDDNELIGQIQKFCSSLSSIIKEMNDKMAQIIFTLQLNINLSKNKFWIVSLNEINDLIKSIGKQSVSFNIETSNLFEIMNVQFQEKLKKFSSEHKKLINELKLSKSNMKKSKITYNNLKNKLSKYVDEISQKKSDQNTKKLLNTNLQGFESSLHKNVNQVSFSLNGFSKKLENNYENKSNKSIVRSFESSNLINFDSTQNNSIPFSTNFNQDSLNTNKDYIKLLQKFMQSKEKYCKNLKESNYLIEKNQKECSEIINNLFEVEVIKSNFLITVLSKLQKFLKLIAEEIQNKSNSINSFISESSYSFDKSNQLFMTSENGFLLKEEIEVFKREEFSDVDSNYHLDYPIIRINPENSEENKNLSSSSEVLKHLRKSELFKEEIEKLLENKSINLIPELFNQIENEEGRQSFDSVLGKISNRIIIKKKESFEQICNLLSTYLNSLYFDDNSDLSYICRGIQSLKYIGYEDNKKFIYSFQKLKNNNIWKEFQIWIYFFEFLIRQKINNCLNKYDVSKLTRIQIKESEEENLIEKLSKQNKDKNCNEIEMKNMIGEALNELVCYFYLFNVDQEKAMYIIEKYFKQFNLEKKRRADVLIRYSSIFSIKTSTKNKKLKEKANQILNLVSLYKTAFIIRRAIQFLKDKTILRNILLTSSVMKDLLQKNIFSHILLTLEYNNILPQRAKIWDQILSTNEIEITDFEIDKKIANENTYQIKEENKSIILDIRRSFNNFQDIIPEKLITILRCILLDNKSITYCQGMNYLCGFVYFNFNNEEKAFRVLKILIEKYELDKLYTQSMHFLNILFYIFDKLLSTYLPDVTSTLLLLNISSSFYASSWLVTIFSSSLQYAKDCNSPILLNTIWDIFLIYKWKGVFKVCLFLMSFIKNKIEGKKFEEVICFLIEIIKSDIFRSEEINNQLKSSLNRWKVTNSMIKKYSREYDSIYENPDEFLQLTKHKIIM